MSDNIPQSNLLEMQRTFVERCAKGEFVEVMEDYYAEDAYQIEMGDGTRREGRANMVAFEKEFLDDRLRSFMVATSAPSQSHPTMATATA